MYPISIEGPRLALRELREDDLDALCAIYGSERATEHMSFEPRDRDQVAGILAGGMKDAVAEPRTIYLMAVVPVGADELVGFGRLAVEAWSAGQIGFMLSPKVWSQGYGTETVALLLRLGFGELGLHRVWGARSPKNVGSATVMTRNGMAEEGRIRHHVFTHGAWRDSITHTIIEDEWSEQS